MQIVILGKSTEVFWSFDWFEGWHHSPHPPISQKYKGLIYIYHICSSTVLVCACLLGLQGHGVSLFDSFKMMLMRDFCDDFGKAYIETDLEAAFVPKPLWVC